MASSRHLFLAVDDEPLFIRSVIDGISPAWPDLRVIGAGNGAEALAVIEREEVSVLLTDLRMPTMDGFELLAQLVSQNFRAPIIVATALEIATIERRIQSLPGVHYLEKPIDLDDLLELLDQLLSKDSAKIDRGLRAFLQLLAAERRTVLVHLRSEHQTGYIAFLDGRLVDAQTGNLNGDDAALEILSWPDPTLDPRMGVIPLARTVESPLLDLLSYSSTPVAASHQKTLVLSKGQARRFIEIAMEIEGALGAAIVDYESGMTLGSKSSQLDVEPAACANTEVVRAEIAAIRALRLEATLEDILISLKLQYHLIRPLAAAPSYFLYLVIDRTKCSLGMAHRQLSKIEKELLRA